jgi:hypothetical protein
MATLEALVTLYPNEPLATITTLLNAETNRLKVEIQLQKIRNSSWNKSFCENIFPEHSPPLLLFLCVIPYLSYAFVCCFNKPDSWLIWSQSLLTPLTLTGHSKGQHQQNQSLWEYVSSCTSCALESKSTKSTSTSCHSGQDQEMVPMGPRKKTEISLPSHDKTAYKEKKS